MSPPFRPTLCIDFDGVIHLYSRGWQDGEIYDSYVPGFFRWAISAVAVGFDLVVYSSRSSTTDGTIAMGVAVGKWSIDAIEAGEVSPSFEWPLLFDHLTFSATKPAAFLTIDDRAIQFGGDWTSPLLDPAALLQFKPWNIPPTKGDTPDMSLMDTPSPSLDATEAVGAKNSTHPRVTLASMKARIASEHYFTAGDAVPFDHPSPLDLLTICVLILDNGWTLLGKSAPASPDNFDAEKGRTFAYEDALRQLWPLEGYLLRERLNGGDL